MLKTKMQCDINKPCFLLSVYFSVMCWGRKTKVGLHFRFRNVFIDGLKMSLSPHPFGLFMVKDVSFLSSWCQLSLQLMPAFSSVYVSFFSSWCQLSLSWCQLSLQLMSAFFLLISAFSSVDVSFLSSWCQLSLQLMSNFSQLMSAFSPVDVIFLFSWCQIFFQLMSNFFPVNVRFLSRIFLSSSNLSSEDIRFQSFWQLCAMCNNDWQDVLAKAFPKPFFLWPGYLYASPSWPTQIVIAFTGL